MNTANWHSRPFIAPAGSRDEAEKAARQYLEWEINAGMALAFRYEAEGECGYHITRDINGGSISIPNPNGQEWKFDIKELMATVKFLL